MRGVPAETSPQAVEGPGNAWKVLELRYQALLGGSAHYRPQLPFEFSERRQVSDRRVVLDPLCNLIHRVGKTRSPSKSNHASVMRTGTMQTKGTTAKPEWRAPWISRLR
jgi:hypothetical protein